MSAGQSGLYKHTVWQCVAHGGHPLRAVHDHPVAENADSSQHIRQLTFEQRLRCCGQGCRQRIQQLRGR